MTNARKYAGGSRYIKLDDLHESGPLREQIAVVKEEAGKYGDKLVLVFESGKQLSLNTTSVGNLIRDIDQDTDNWIGHFVEVYAGEVEFQNGMAGAVLVRLVDGDTSLKPPIKTSAAPTSPTPPRKKTANSRRGDMDDEIPF